MNKSVKNYPVLQVRSWICGGQGSWFVLKSYHMMLVEMPFVFVSLNIMIVWSCWNFLLSSINHVHQAMTVFFWYFEIFHGKKSINIFLFSICWLEGNTFSEQNMLTLQNCKINLFVLVSLKVFCVHYPESYKYSSTVMTTFCKLLL